MITKQEILMGRDKIAPLSKELESNLEKLLKSLNIVRKAYNKPLRVSSGYRPPAINATVAGAASKSSHMTCEACDFSDPSGEFAKWCLNNLSILKSAGLYMEDPRYTHSDKGGKWVHLQIRVPGSKKRIFIPSNSPAPNPSFWDGKYDNKQFDN